MSKDEQKSKEYFDDLKEWQRKQYMPGYYTGGKLPPAMKYGGMRYLKTIFIFAVAAIVLTIIVALLTQ